MSSYEGLTFEDLVTNASGYVAPAIRVLANAIQENSDEKRYLEVKSVEISINSNVDSGEEAENLAVFTVTGVDTDTGLVYKIYRNTIGSSSKYFYTASVIGVRASSDFSQGLFVPRTITFKVSALFENGYAWDVLEREARVTTFDNVTFSRYRTDNDDQVTYGDWIYAPWVETFNASIKVVDDTPITDTQITVPFTKIEFPRCKTFTATGFVENSTTAASGDVWMNLSAGAIELIDFSSLSKVPISKTTTTVKTMDGLFKIIDDIIINTLKLGVGICGYDISTNIYVETPFNVFAYSSDGAKTVSRLIFVSSEFGSTCYHSAEIYGSFNEIPGITHNTGNAAISTGSTIVDVYVPRIIALQSRMGNDQLLTFSKNMLLAPGSPISIDDTITPTSFNIY